MDDPIWLTGPEAENLLDEAVAKKVDPAKFALSLRKKLDPNRARLVTEQLALRQKATVKFPDAARLFFTPIGLEQSTDCWVAAYKAQRFPSNTDVADLCCGIGGDAMAIGLRNIITLVDNDPATLHYAFENLRRTSPGREHRALMQNVEDIDLSPMAAWHIDPDRRPSGNRTTQPELHSPSLSAIRTMLEANPNGAIKLAPAGELHGDWPDDAEMEWIGRDRQCRQLVVWHGDLAKAPCTRAATVIRSGQAPSCEFQSETFRGDNYVVCDRCDAIGRFVFEPDSAILAADLWGDLAARHDLKTPTPSIPYLTADTLPDDLPHLLFSTFETVAVMPLDRKKLRAELRRLDIGRLEIKKRGVDINPEILRRELKLKGENGAVLIVLPHAGHIVAVIARRASL